WYRPELALTGSNPFLAAAAVLIRLEKQAQTRMQAVRTPGEATAAPPCAWALQPCVQGCPRDLSEYRPRCRQPAQAPDRAAAAVQELVQIRAARFWLLQCRQAGTNQASAD